MNDDNKVSVSSSRPLNCSTARDKQTIKPPIGVMPEYLWLEEIEVKEPDRHAIPMSNLIQARICDLTRAINDYAHFKQDRRQLVIIEIWTEELQRRIKDRRFYGCIL